MRIKIPETYYVNNDYTNVTKVYEELIEIRTGSKHKKHRKTKKTSFPKEQIENRDLYKPVLNKIMTAQEQCVKYNFAAPLRKVYFCLRKVLIKWRVSIKKSSIWFYIDSSVQKTKSYGKKYPLYSFVLNCSSGLYCIFSNFSPPKSFYNDPPPHFTKM